MKSMLIMTCATAILGVAVYSTWDQYAGRLFTQAAPVKVAERHMGYRTLSNGTVIYAEMPAEVAVDSAPQDIAPAAGGDNERHEPSYKYDPLTQTIRRTAH